MILNYSLYSRIAVLLISLLSRFRPITVGLQIFLYPFKISCDAGILVHFRRILTSRYGR